MPVDWKALEGKPRILIEAALKPVAGTRIQPTGIQASQQMNSPRRRFLGSSLVLLGSTLLDALATPLWKWNRSVVLASGRGTGLPCPSVGASQTTDVSASHSATQAISPVTFVDVACRKHRWNARVTPKMLYGKERK